ASTTTTAGRIVLGVPKEIVENERRVALIPDAVKKYTSDGHKVLVQSGAGLAAAFTDESYAAAGATVVPDAASVYGGAELILKVQRPQEQELDLLRPGTALIAFLQPLVNTDLVAELARRKVTAFSMD